MTLSVRLAGLATFAAVMAVPSAAQRPPTSPSTWAITGARIVTVSGAPIASGTVVIRNGLIAAVGSNVDAPADARVIDGSGMTVYPGFIDTYGSLGLPSANAQRGATAQGGESAPNPAPNSRYGTGMQAEIDVVDLLAPTATSFRSAREAGFTAALTAQPSGIFRGSSALISLGNGTVNELVIARELSQNIGFSRGRGGFPSSLMGVFAQFRQQLLDAAHYAEVQRAYSSNPNGKLRPEHDPTLEALQPVLNGVVPVIFDANSEREIRRALGLSAEFGLKAIVAGGREASAAATELASANVPVLLDIDLPHKTASGGASSDETPESMRVLRDRVARPKVGGQLRDARVAVAITAGDEFDKFAANLRQVVAAGMSSDDALRSITVVPAMLFGVDDRLGTIETGKIANLTVFVGDLFSEGSKVYSVFIDGQQFEIAEPEKSAESSDDSSEEGRIQ